MGLSERIAFVKNFIKLKQQEEIIEKGNNIFFNGLKINPEILQNLKEERDVCLKKRNKVIKQLYCKVSEYNLAFENIKEIVNQFHNGEFIDIKYCETSMINLLEKLKSFDVTEQLETLEKEQKELEEFYYDFKANMAKIENQKQFRIKRSLGRFKGLSTEKINRTCDVIKYQEIKDFESLVMQTGHTENWKEEDHRLFLKVRNKYHNLPEMVIGIRKKCPDISVEQIVNHEAWYKIYLDLREKQRCLVKEWRTKKELEKKEKIEAIKNAENKTGSGKAGVKCKIKNNDIEFHASLNNSLNMFKLRENINESLNKKELIKQWKTHKENMEKADREQIKSQQNIERLKKETEFHKRNLKIKAAVNEYKQQKMKKIFELSLSKNSRNEGKIRSPKILKNFRKQDEAFVKKRLKFLRSKKNKTIRKQFIYCNKNIKNSNTRRSPDQSTLMKPTKIWNEKCKPESPTHITFNPILYIKNIPQS